MAEGNGSLKKSLLYTPKQMYDLFFITVVAVRLGIVLVVIIIIIIMIVVQDAFKWKVNVSSTKILFLITVIF